MILFFILKPDLRAAVAHWFELQRERSQVRSPLFLSFRFGRNLALHQANVLALCWCLENSSPVTKHNEPVLGQNTYKKVKLYFKLKKHGHKLVKRLKIRYNVFF